MTTRSTARWAGPSRLAERKLACADTQPPHETDDGLRMWRSLMILAFLSGCASREREPPPPQASLQAWLDTWLEARRCLVGDAEDTRTGVAIGMLVGRDCARPLHQLEAMSRTGDAGLDRAWSAAVERIPGIAAATTPEMRANEIDVLDAFARALGFAINRWIPPSDRGAKLPLLADPEEMFGGKRVMTTDFSGGFPHALQSPPPDSDDWAISVDQYGNKLLYTQVMQDLRRPWPIAHADSPSQALLVWMPRNYAYAIDVTPKGGTTTTSFVRGNLDRWWQDARTGEVIMVVDARRTQIHRLRPGSSAPLVAKTFPLTSHFRKTCLHGGEVWGLEGETVVRVTSPERRIFELGGISKGMHLDCRGDTALLLRHFPDVIERCREDACEEVFTSDTYREGVAALLDDGRWIYASELDGVVAVWVEGEAGPQLFRFPGMPWLVAITESGGKPALVVSAYASGIYHRFALPKPPAAGLVTAHTQP